MKKIFLFGFLIFGQSLCFSDPQTFEVSPVLPEKELSFRVKIELVNKDDGTPFLLPGGLHSYVSAYHKSKFLFMTGRTNGMHTFNNQVVGNENFPASKQNTTVFLVDPENKKIFSRDLSESGLTQHQIDLLSVTAAQNYQWPTPKPTLYIVGGYGINSKTGKFSTKNTLTAIDISPYTPL